MKTSSTAFLLLLGLVTFTGNALSRANAQAKPTVVRAAQSITITGIVTADEKSVITHNYKEIWTVANPAALKGHAGQRVTITAKVGAKDAVSVESIRVLTPKYPCCP